MSLEVNMTNPFYLAVDIGGTDIKFAVVDSLGTIIERGQLATRKCGEDILSSVADIAHVFKRDFALAGAAFSLPGMIDSVQGYMHTGGAIRDFDHFPFRKVMENRLQMPVAIENDVNCIALAEKWLGNARQCDNFVCISLGTGVGGAVFVNGELLRGHRYMAGEFGYMLTQDVFEHPESITTMSFTASVREGLRKSYWQQSSAGENFDDISGKEVYRRAAAGDTVARQVIERFYQNIAIGLYNLTFALNPQKILIGGAISQNRELCPNIMQKMQTIINREPAIKFTPLQELVEIEPTRFYNDSGLIGAVYHFIHHPTLLKQKVTYDSITER